MPGQGATEDAINALPLVTVEADTLRHTDGDSTCPICLSDMALGEQVRVMPCKHVFHSQVGGEGGHLYCVISLVHAL